MLERIKANDELSAQSYGSRRMQKALNGLGYPVSRNKVRQLIREAGVEVRYRKKDNVTTNSNHKQPVFANWLQRQFSVSQLDQVYAADVTYVWTQEGCFIPGRCHRPLFQESRGPEHECGHEGTAGL